VDAVEYLRFAYRQHDVYSDDCTPQYTACINMQGPLVFG
jgi:hypothetical protein